MTPVSFSNAQASYDAMSPDDGQFFHQHEHLALCFEEAEAKLRFLFKNIDTFEKHVPEEHQDRAEIRARANSLCELIEDQLGAYGGRLFDPLTELARLVKKYGKPFALTMAANGHAFVGTIERDKWQPIGSGATPLLAVNETERKYQSNGAGDNGL